MEAAPKRPAPRQPMRSQARGVKERRKPTSALRVAYWLANTTTQTLLTNAFSSPAKGGWVRAGRGWLTLE